MDRKLAVSVQTGYWLHRYFGEAHADEALAWIRQFGFTALDLNLDCGWPSELAAAGEVGPRYQKGVEEALEEFRPLKDALLKYDMFVGQAHSTFPLWREGMDEINEALMHAVEIDCAVCQYVGCPYLVVHSLCMPDAEKEWELNLAMYRRMIPHAKKYGVTLCLENLINWRNGHFLTSTTTAASDACKYIDTLNAEAGEELFGFCFDAGHANASGRNLRDDLRTLGNRVKVLHLHDNDGTKDMHLIPFTQQHTGEANRLNTDWDGFLAGLRDIGYEGTVNFETDSALGPVPRALHPAMMRLIGEIGYYFRDRLLEEK